MSYGLKEYKALLEKNLIELRDPMQVPFGMDPYSNLALTYRQANIGSINYALEMLPEIKDPMKDHEFREQVNELRPMVTLNNFEPICEHSCTNSRRNVMRYKASHTFMIDFDSTCICTDLFQEIDLFKKGWPNAEVSISMTTISVTYPNRRVAVGAADMLLSRLRSFTWFKEKVV